MGTKQNTTVVPLAKVRALSRHFSEISRIYGAMADCLEDANLTEVAIRSMPSFEIGIDAIERAVARHSSEVSKAVAAAKEQATGVEDAGAYVRKIGFLLAWTRVSPAKPRKPKSPPKKKPKGR